MKLPNHVTGQAFVPAAQYNELVDCVKFLMQNALVAAGPGLELRSLPQGKAVGVTVAADVCSADEPVILAVTPNALDEDSWNRDEDKTGITVKYITKFRYDPTTRKLQVAYRTETKDSCGRAISISDEPAWVDVTTAELCE